MEALGRFPQPGGLNASQDAGRLERSWKRSEGFWDGLEIVGTLLGVALNASERALERSGRYFEGPRNLAA